jgi:hypothetical protein
MVRANQFSKAALLVIIMSGESERASERERKAIGEWPGRHDDDEDEKGQDRHELPSLVGRSPGGKGKAIVAQKAAPIIVVQLNIVIVLLHWLLRRKEMVPLMRRGGRREWLAGPTTTTTTNASVTMIAGRKNTQVGRPYVVCTHNFVLQKHRDATVRLLLLLPTTKRFFPPAFWDIRSRHCLSSIIVLLYLQRYELGRR